MDFLGLRSKIQSKNWFIDDLGIFHRWLSEEPGDRERTTLFLTDNAGPDFLCGCVPFAMELASYGLRVFIALELRAHSRRENQPIGGFLDLELHHEIRRVRRGVRLAGMDYPDLGISLLDAPSPPVKSCLGPGPLLTGPSRAYHHKRSPRTRSS